MGAVVTKTPAGEDIVILPLSEYEALIEVREDSRDVAAGNEVLARIGSGAEEILTSAEADEYLQAPTPLAFWRRKRGLTQAALAASAGVSQGYVSELEAGRRSGDVSTIRRIANALRLKIDDLVPDEA